MRSEPRGARRLAARPEELRAAAALPGGAPVGCQEEQEEQEEQEKESESTCCLASGVPPSFLLPQRRSGDVTALAR